jgi:uncharacterized protein YigA (DUF484 family)
MNANDIVGYLKDHPGFFEDNAELLAGITVPHPLTGQAIPLVERQVINLRQKNRVLESKLNELIQFGEENDTIAERVHRLSISLILAREIETALSALYDSLREDFGIPHVAARFWRGNAAGPECSVVTDALREYAASLVHPFCGPNANFESASWFAVGGDHVRSVAFMALRDSSGTFGLLALGSEDAKRFYPEMGTVYLGRIGELASAAFARHL